jgi:hypothetical protein
MEMPKRAVTRPCLRGGQGIPTLDDLDEKASLLQKRAFPPGNLLRAEDMGGRRALRPAQGVCEVALGIGRHYSKVKYFVIMSKTTLVLRSFLLWYSAVSHRRHRQGGTPQG